MKLTREQLEKRIADTRYIMVPGTTTMLCTLVLDNGFVVVGKSACIDAKEFNAETGKQVARDDAVRQLWPLFGFFEVESQKWTPDNPAPKFRRDGRNRV